MDDWLIDCSEWLIDHNKWLIDSLIEEFQVTLQVQLNLITKLLFIHGEQISVVLVARPQI